MNRCLKCFAPLADPHLTYHPACAKPVFGTQQIDTLVAEFSEWEQSGLALVQAQTTVPGVQPKLSVGLSPTAGQPGHFRLTVFSRGGNYILKPPTPLYPQLPEVEGLTMQLAHLAGLPTVPFALVWLTPQQQLGYLTRRVDRSEKVGKLPMEDMCQLSLRLAEHKYQGSHEQIAKIIAQYSENPGVDLVRFWELVLFCYLTGNADMHLKNFSLLKSPRTGWRLAPAYDLVATALVNPADKEETALALNGKKRKLNWRDFETAFSTSGLNPKQVGRIVRRMHQASQLWGPAIDNSFLGAEYKAAFHTLLAERMRLLPVG